MKNQVVYYQKRAKEYELVYQKPERQSDILLIKDYLGKQFVDKSIVEIACGTGYWTEILSKQTKSIVASDINPEVIEVARAKKYPKRNVNFELKDIQDLKKMSGSFEGFFGGFIWSHIRKEELNDFLMMALNQVREGAEVLFLDNKYVSNSSTTISRTDDYGNTFQIRTLKSGEQFEVVKNFPNRIEIESLVKDIADDFEWIDLQYYWIFKFKKKENAS